VVASCYFYSVTRAVAPLLNLTSSGGGIDAINKVAVTHLWVLVMVYCFIWLSQQAELGS